MNLHPLAADVQKILVMLTDDVRGTVALARGPYEREAYGLWRNAIPREAD